MYFTTVKHYMPSQRDFMNFAGENRTVEILVLMYIHLTPCYLQFTLKYTV